LSSGRGIKFASNCSLNDGLDQPAEEKLNKTFSESCYHKPTCNLALPFAELKEECQDTVERYYIKATCLEFDVTVFGFRIGKKRIAEIVMGFDFIIVFSIFFGLHLLRFMQKLDIEEIEGNTRTVADYTLKVKNPGQCENHVLLKAHVCKQVELHAPGKHLELANISLGLDDH